MRTIDESLFEIVQRSMGEAYELLSDPTSWTLETRDDMVAKSRALNLSLTAEGVDLIKRLIDAEVDGKSALFLFIFRGTLLGELELFLAARAQIDMATDEQIKDSPFDHSWLTEQIRVRYKEIEAIDLLLEPFNPEEAEEI